MTTWRPLPGRRRDTPDPRPVGDSLDRLSAHLGSPPPAVLRAVFARWAEIVGPTIAANTRPLSVRDGVLLVATEQPAWASQLRFLGPDVVRRVVEVVGEGAVERLEIRVVAPGGEGAPGARPGPPVW